MKEKIVSHRNDIDIIMQNYTTGPTLIVDNIDTFNLSERVLFANISASFIKEAYKSTVGIYSYYKSQSGRSVGFGGSGVFISPSDILTARHVVRECTCQMQTGKIKYWTDCNTGCSPHFHLRNISINPTDPYYPNNLFDNESIIVKVQEYSHTGKSYGWGIIDDVAILKSPNKFGSYARLDDTNCDLNHRIFAVHFPSGWDENERYELMDGAITGQELSKLFGKNRKVISVGNVSNNLKETFTHALFMWWRSSGAGIFNANTGKICGVHVGGDHFGNYAHSMEHPFLKDIFSKLNFKQEL